MTTIEASDHGHVSQGDRWRLFVAMLVFAAGVSFYQTWSLLFPIRDDIRPLSHDVALFMAGFTFASIVSYAVGFTLLAGLLDIWTGRRAQPLAAMNLALPAAAIIELFKMPLLMMGFQVWFWAIWLFQ